MMLDVGRTLYENLAATAERRPDAAALVFLDAHLRRTVYTYRRLFAQSAAVAAALRSRGLPRTAPLGILLQSQEDQTVHYLAALAAGHVPAILTPPNRKLNRDYYLDTMRSLVATCRFAAVVADLEAPDLPVTLLEPYTLREVRRGPDDGPSHLQDAAFLQFSSGTTGFKRGVLVSDKAALLQLSCYAEALRLAADDCIVSWLPLYHDMGFMACLNMPLAAGVPCVMLHPLDWVADPGSYLRAVAAFRGTLGWNPNFSYAFMADRSRPADVEGLDLSSLRGLVNCSEPVTWESQERFRRRFAAFGLRPDVFLGCYAMAETAFALTHGRSSDAAVLDYQGPAGGFRAAAMPLVSAGRPLPSVELKVADCRGQTLPDRQAGELLVRAPFTFTSYFNNAEATAGAFRDGWHRTGDLGYRVGEEVFVIGRTRDMLIVGGVNVFPQDIEELVSRIDGVRPGRVVAFSEFDAAAQTERVVILGEADAAEGRRASLTVEIRQRILALLQIANFEVHLVPPGWLVKSSSGKAARLPNKARWAARGRGEAPAA
jgi:acyl-CoA synthetase (AMP-forming)/AMP-acid ligase II